MSRNLFLAVLLAIAPVSAALACQVMMFTWSDEVKRALDENGWGFRNYEQICDKLNAANAALEISGVATVLDGVSVSWASVNLRDKDVPIFTNAFAGAATEGSLDARMEVARDMLGRSIDNAVDAMDIDEAIEALDENRNQVRAAYAKD